MEFSNLYFLYILLPLTLLVYFLMPDVRRKNLVLLVVSLLFYAMGQPIYLALLVGLSYVNYKLALKIRPKDQFTLILPVVLNLAVLALFKYLDFFLGIFGVASENGGFLLGLVKGMVNGLNSILHLFCDLLSCGCLCRQSEGREVLPESAAVPLHVPQDAPGPHCPL